MCALEQGSSPLLHRNAMPRGGQVHSKVNHLADMVEQMMDERFQRDKAITAELNAVQLKVCIARRLLKGVEGLGTRGAL